MDPTNQQGQGQGQGQQQKDKVEDQAYLVASRYMTTICHHYATGNTGACPYRKKCLFAHSAEQLRSKEMNLAEGITTKEAVRAHKRFVKKMASGTSSPSQASSPPATFVLDESSSDSYMSCSDLVSSVESIDTKVTVDAEVITRRFTPTMRSLYGAKRSKMTPSPPVPPSHKQPISPDAQGIHSHSPYKTQWMYNADCECSQCGEFLLDT